MSIWETLGLEPTDDLRAVRRAYAAKTLHCHPEEDPEGFRRLHEAYAAALTLARGMGRKASPPPPGEGAPEAAPLLRTAAPAKGPAPPPEEAPMDVSAHISKGLEEVREEEAHWRKRRVARMLETLDALAAQCQAPDFYLSWKRCLGSIPFQAVMLEEDFLQGLETLLTVRDTLPEGACLALYLAYGFSEHSFWAGHPLLGGLYDRLSWRIPRPVRRETDPKTEAVRSGQLRLGGLWRKSCRLLLPAGLTLLLGLLGPLLGPAGAVCSALGGPLGLWGLAVLVRRARIQKWPSHQVLTPAGWVAQLAPLGLTLAEILLLYATAGGALQAAAADPATRAVLWCLLLAVCAIPPVLVLLLCGSFVLLGGEELVLSLPTAPYRVVRWEAVVAVRRQPTARGAQLLFLLSDGTSLSLLTEWYIGGQALAEAADRRGLLF